MTSLTKQHFGLPHSAFKQFNSEEVEILNYHLSSPLKLRDYDDPQIKALAGYLQKMVSY